MPRSRSERRRSSSTVVRRMIESRTRMVATARIVLPRSVVRLSAGRTEMSPEAQALCFLAGANSIFAGEKLLTTPNPGEDQDRALLAALGMEPL